MKGNGAVGREGGCRVGEKGGGGNCGLGLRGQGKFARSGQGVCVGLLRQEGRAVEPSVAEG